MAKLEGRAAALLAAVVFIVPQNLLGCSGSGSRSCDDALKRRTSGSAPCYEDRCEYLTRRAELQVSFRFTLETADGSAGSSERESDERSCVIGFLRDSGLDVVSQDEFPNDIVAVGSFRDVRPALRLAIVASVEPGCVGGCKHCRTLNPGAACSEDPFCRTVSGQRATLGDACVQFGNREPAACLDDGEGCREKVSQAIDPDGSCWYFASECPGIENQGWKLDECVTSELPACPM